MPSRPLNTGKLCDPFFLFMLAAVLLALGSSFILRAAVNRYTASATQTPAQPPAPNP
jgi:hypothetical protein